MKTLARPFRALAILAALAAPALLTACSGDDDSAQTDPNVQLVNYVTRGRVVQLPSPDSPAAQFQVHHEPIPSFMSRGEVVGMNAMVMPFPLAPGLSLEGVAVGDIVELSFTVEYEADTGIPENFSTTRVTKLPPDTALDLGRVREDAAPGE